MEIRPLTVTGNRGKGDTHPLAQLHPPAPPPVTHSLLSYHLSPPATGSLGYENDQRPPPLLVYPIFLGLLCCAQVSGCLRLLLPLDEASFRWLHHAECCMTLQIRTYEKPLLNETRQSKPSFAAR